MAVLRGIFAGRPRQRGTADAADPHDRPWLSGFYKDAVSGPVAVGSGNLAGDGQADLRVHGGPDRAILAYSGDHYPAWREELGRTDMGDGAFGENFTISGLSEDTACLGDSFSVGTALVQVSQPRAPCWKLARRWRLNDLPARAIANGRLGWYLRVLREGICQAGDAFTLQDRPHPEFAIARLNRLFFARVAHAAELAAVVALPELSDLGRELFQRKMDGEKA